MLRSAGSYDRVGAAKAARYFPSGPGKAIQSGKDEADINIMVRRFGVVGVPQNVPMPPLNGDFSEAMDLKESLDLMRQADQSFMAMSSKVRARFGNDARQFVDFCSDKENLAEMRKFGLAVPEKVVIESPPMKVEVVSPKPKEG